MHTAIEKSAMQKIYIRLLPFAILSYFLAYVDRINVSFAALTMRDDLKMSATAYGFALGTFYWAYFIFEVPSNIVMEKVGARLWIARIMITWGLLACATAYVTGATSFGIVRFLLGAAEAQPGTAAQNPARSRSQVNSCLLIAAVTATGAERLSMPENAE
jgi:MFS transporter, ACS family, tartrate transporter